MTFAPCRITGSPPVPAADGMRRLLCAVRLIDRRTGSIHRMNGRPVLVVTRTPIDAVADMMTGRNPTVWEARVDTIEQVAR